jgi:hypothetical protein
VGMRHHGAVDCAVQWGCRLAADPAAADETLEYLGHDVLNCANGTRTNPAELTDRADWKYYAFFQPELPMFSSAN